MGLKDIWTTIINVIDTEYDRRIRGASNIREYHIGGHDHHDDHHAAPPEEQPGEPLIAYGTGIKPADVDPAATSSSH